MSPQLHSILLLVCAYCCSSAHGRLVKNPPLIYLPVVPRCQSFEHYLDLDPLEYSIRKHVVKVLYESDGKFFPKIYDCHNEKLAFLYMRGNTSFVDEEGKDFFIGEYEYEGELGNVRIADLAREANKNWQIGRLGFTAIGCGNNRTFTKKYKGSDWYRFNITCVLTQ